MNMIKKLKSVVKSVEDLSCFVEENSDDIFNFFINQSQVKLQDYREDIDIFLLAYFKTIKKLDLTIGENEIFIDSLIDVTERLNLSMYFQRLCNIKIKSQLSIYKRNEAVSLYINGLRNIADYSIVLIDFLNNLQSAFEMEEDSDKRVLAIFFNFYANIIRDFGQFNLDGVKSLVEQIKIQQKNYSFLNNEIVKDIFAIDIVDNEKTFLNIHSILDRYLERAAIDIVYDDQKYLIEIGTEYANELNKVESNIVEIRKLACSLCSNSDSVFYSLGRGVSILKEEDQLYTYLKSYGNMHYAKCNYAYDSLPSHFFNNDLEIIDWGSGQALASMTYLDFLKTNKIDQTIKKITLIEPSLIALKRGALHLKLYDMVSEIRTINKDLNSLTIDDFITNSSKIKLHIFSNILDINDYSIKQLSCLIKEKFMGQNYFIIISPKITELKTNRINNFVNEFNMESFTKIKFENKDVGEWKNKWTMILRIFKIYS